MFNFVECDLLLFSLFIFRTCSIKCHHHNPFLIFKNVVNDIFKETCRHNLNTHHREDIKAQYAGSCTRQQSKEPDTAQHLRRKVNSGQGGPRGHREGRRGFSRRRWQLREVLLRGHRKEGCHRAPEVWGDHLRIEKSQMFYGK